MDEKQFLEAMNKGFTNIGDRLSDTLTTQLATLNETAKKVLEVKPEDIQSPAEVAAEAESKAEKAEMQQLGGITQFEVWDIPIGEGLVGGFSAVFASELIDGFLVRQSDWIKGLVKLAGAGVAVKWGSRLLGKTGSKAAAILLAYDGIRSLIPIDSWARRGAKAVTGVAAGGGLGGFRPGVREENLSLISSGGGKAYYDALKGGAR